MVSRLFIISLVSAFALLGQPAHARFISEDPAGFGGGSVNLYAYCQNNPINCNDPSGKVYIFVGGAGDATYKNVQGFANNFNPGNGQAVKYYSWTQGSQIQNFINSQPSREPVNLIGHSYGGDTAATITANSPRQINMLVTIDPVSHIRPDFDSVTSNSNMWINVNAQTNNPTERSNIIAGIGGAWNNAPQGQATSFINSNTNHANFDTMMNATGPGARSPSDLLMDGDIAGRSTQIGGAAANGGFLIYPNKPNNNSLISVYRK